MRNRTNTAMELEDLQARLRRLPRRTPPPELGASLRVMASRERLRKLGQGFTWRDRLTIIARDLMRPFAVPAFGGLASAVVIFCALMPSLAMPMPQVQNDVPTALVTEASVKYFAPIGLRESEIVVDLIVDGSGRMVDYSVVSGAHLLQEDRELRRQLENNLLFTEFTPATFFGGPASGRLRLFIKSSQINIRG